MDALDINTNHLRELENESVFIMREVAAQFERPVLLFSGGKDSILLVHLAKKAFWPAKIPFTQSVLQSMCSIKNYVSHIF